MNAQINKEMYHSVPVRGKEGNSGNEEEEKTQTRGGEKPEKEQRETRERLGKTRLGVEAGEKMPWHIIEGRFGAKLLIDKSTNLAGRR